MSKHTKGPWRKCGFNVSVSPKCYYLLKNTDKIAASELSANARLIAAAPDLLAACEQQREAIDRLFAILIRAQGSDKPFFPSKCGQPWDALCQGNAATTKATD